MDEQTKAALEDSIAHWTRLADGANEQIGPETCALCQLFMLDNCEGCPVSARSGGIWCENTPYEKAFYQRARCGVRGSSEEFRKAAAAERDFLISLREGTK